MVGNPSESNFSSQVEQRILSQFKGDWVRSLNVDQMFTLISGVLPLEACLYYQVLPLFLDGTRLHLGMVSPNDTSALEYVRRIISYLNYSLVPRAITYDALQVALTGYLNYTGNSTPGGLKQRATYSYGHHRHASQGRAEPLDPSNRPTLIVDSPDDLDDSELAMPAPVDPPPYIPASPTPPPIPPLKAPANPNASVEKSDAIPELSDLYNAAPNDPPPSAPCQPALPDASLPLPPLPSLIEKVPSLKLEASHLADPVDVLATLSAEELLQELLARVLIGGIGRLYFESHPQYGRILWSQDGILQSVLEQLPLPLFNQVLTALKHVAELPDVISHPHNVDVERMYEQNRVLLRFRFMMGKYGEEATLQVLRGAALRFYQKQQISKLQRDALGITKQLQTKLNEIRDRAYAEPGLAAARFEALPALNDLLQNLEQQINSLTSQDQQE